MKLNHWLKAFYWPMTTVAIYGLFKEYIYTKVALPLWSYLVIAEGGWLDVSMIMISFMLIGMGLMVGCKSYSPTHLGLYVSTLCLLCLFWFDNDRVPYLYFMGVIPCWVMAFCSFTIGIIIKWIIIYRQRKSNISIDLDNQISLLKDFPKDSIIDDKLAFEPLAKRIVNSILKNKVNNSFSIGITGIWGSGKTSLLNFIKEYLEKLNDVVLIDFSPRQSATIADIQKDFMTEFGEALSRYHSGTLRLTRRYAYAIGAIPEKLWPLNFIFGFSQVGTSELRGQIKNIITTTGIRIVVMIDDFDRLTGEEIKEVFKLIDKNASFPNTFFITAYDKVRTNKVIESYFGEGSMVDYTDKYFTLEIPLPIRQSIRYSSIMYEHMKGLIDNKTLSCTQDVIDIAMSRVKYFIPTYLPTLRDIKRFINLIAISLPPVEKEVIVDEFILVSLIRYRYPDEYMALCQYKYVDTQQITGDIYLKPGLADSPDKDAPKSLQILRLLFNTGLNQYKSISKTNSFNFYFYDIDAGHLRYDELASLLDPDITLSKFRSAIAPWLNDKMHKRDFIEFVISQEEHIKNLNDAKHYMQMFLMARTCCNSSELYLNILAYFRSDNAQNNTKLFGFDKVNDYATFMKDALMSMFDWSICIETIHDLLCAITNVEAQDTLSLIVTTEDLKEIANARLKQVCSLFVTGDVKRADVHAALSACVCEYISGHGESISKESIEYVKSEIKYNPKIYFSSLLSHTKYDNSRIKFCLPEKNIFNLLFNDYDELSKFVCSIEILNERLMNCWIEYLERCKAQKTWTPLLTVNGDISKILPYDYNMYNKLFEGEHVDA